MQNPTPPRPVAIPTTDSRGSSSQYAAAKPNPLLTHTTGFPRQPLTPYAPQSIASADLSTSAQGQPPTHTKVASSEMPPTQINNTAATPTISQKHVPGVSATPNHVPQPHTP
ncbi:hypothetical protein U1Q18_035301 [Sarracenia purpurea var. burkii]